MEENGAPRRVIEIGKQILGPSRPKARNVTRRNRGDYPNMPAVYLDVAERLASPMLMGPPLCDELLALVSHVFTEEEAGAVRHLGTLRGKTAPQVAAAEHRSVDQVEPVLEHVSRVKHAIFSSGPKEATIYRMLPVVPGMFEMILIAHTPETITPWHRRFAELFEALFETGYTLDYSRGASPVVRYLPVGQATDAHPMALPSDRMGEILDRFKLFAIGQCQCRTAMELVGKGCGRPKGNCLVVGDWAESGIEEGTLKQVTREEAIAIKREAEDHGMVNWMMNVQNTRGQSSCSCCGCCCHAMRIINEFNAPGLVAPPHFLPRWNTAQCTYCGRCAKQCPMGAITIHLESRKLAHSVPRCIGCGLCAVACQAKHAVTMEPAATYRGPYRSWFSLFAHTLPKTLSTFLKVWRQRR